MNVSDAMTRQLVVCLKSDTAQSVATLMKKHNIGCIPVVSDLVSKHLEGIVTDRDICVRLVAENGTSDTTQVGALMTRNPITCGPNYSLQQCEQFMRENKIRHIPIVDKQAQCVGIVTQTNIVLHDNSENVGKMLAAISTPKHGVYVGARALA
jgi:CBS domain-containing protein